MQDLAALYAMLANRGEFPAAAAARTSRRCLARLLSAEASYMTMDMIAPASAP